jgi:hypothetical protein
LATATKLDTKRESTPTIRPDLKAMIERVIVPILVRDYLDVLRREKQVEAEGPSVTPYVPANTALAEKVATE